MGGRRGEERECLASPSVLDLSPSHGVVPPAMGGDPIAPSRVVSDLARPRPQEALAKVVFIQSVGAAVARSDLCCAVTDAQKQHLRRMNSNVLDALWERRDSTNFPECICHFFWSSSIDLVCGHQTMLALRFADCE